MNRSLVKIIGILCVGIFFSSCSRLSYGLMSTEGKRNELRTISAKVVKAVSWAEFAEVAKFTKDDVRDKAIRQLSDQYKSIKIKEVKETNLDFDEDVLTAYQVLEIEGFSQPSYVVKSEYTQFTWTFSPSTEGWKITGITFSGKDSSIQK